MNRKALFCVLSAISCAAFSFPCYLTALKSNCWNDYHVSIQMLDVENEKTAVKIDLPQDKLWARQAFECHPKQTFRFESQFSPAIWKDDEGKTYKGKRYWSLPVSTENAAAWNMTICYPDDFSGVPVPQDANKCGCDRTQVPPIQSPEKNRLD